MNLGLSVDEFCLGYLQHLPQAGCARLVPLVTLGPAVCSGLTAQGSVPAHGVMENRQVEFPGGAASKPGQTSALPAGTGNQRHLLWTTPKAVVAEESW